MYIYIYIRVWDQTPGLSEASKAKRIDFSMFLGAGARPVGGFKSTVCRYPYKAHILKGSKVPNYGVSMVSVLGIGRLADDCREVPQISLYPIKSHGSGLG